MMAFHGRIPESAAATKTFDALRIEGRVLTTPSRTIPIANISTITVGTHVPPKPVILYWGLAVLFLVMTFGSMRPDLSFGPLAPTGASVVLGFITLAFAGLALRPQDKTPYLLISSNDGVLSRFTAPDRAILNEVRGILTEKINRGDDSLVFSINFENGQIENLATGMTSLPSQRSSNGASHAQAAVAAPAERISTQNGVPRTRPPVPDTPRGAPRQIRTQPALPSPVNGASPTASTFVDYSTVLSAIVEMHRFYARQPNTQHLEQRLSELELLMRAGTPTPTQKARLRELSNDMSQILQAYPQAVELFDHIGSLLPGGPH
ncbi:DUF6232 family protein [Hyphomicrobium denitrificans]|nr:DUF6232 family protein [Hyphomicrobium denitrificans]